MSSATVPLLEVSDLTVDFALPRPLLGKKRTHRAVDAVSFTVARHETLGLVGESGAGKSTIGRAILGLVRPTAGRILFDGIDLTTASRQTMKQLRPQMQVVFQNPYASLNPRRTVGDAIGEAISVHEGLHGAELDSVVADLLRRVGLDPNHATRYPAAFSGGQRQRIAVARAIALKPRLLVADEPVSALDVSTRGQILNLLDDLGEELGLAALFIGHDLAVVRHVSDRIAVLYGGRIAEIGPADEVADHPRHPYTKRLVAAVPVADPAVQAERRAVRLGEAMEPVDSSGCLYAPRCPQRMDHCSTTPPEPHEVEGVVVLCHLYSPSPRSPVRSQPASPVLRAGRPLSVSVTPTPESAGELAAERILAGLATRRPSSPFWIACPAGRTPITTYAALGRLAAARGADLSAVMIAMVDEYVMPDGDGFGLCDPTAHFSCRGYVDEHLLPVVNAGLPVDHRIPEHHVRCPDPADPAAFDDELRGAGGIDLFLLASGASDGHVAFNPPGTPLDSGTRVVDLAESTRRDNLETFPAFRGLHEVPHHGVTVGLHEITRAREVVLLLIGDSKRQAFERLRACGDFDPSWPASVVYRCPNRLVIVDAAAAGGDHEPTSGAEKEDA